jgi:hypothetical protein
MPGAQRYGVTSKRHASETLGIGLRSSAALANDAETSKTLIEVII